MLADFNITLRHACAPDHTLWAPPQPTLGERRRDIADGILKLWYDWPFIPSGVENSAREHGTMTNGSATEIRLLTR